MHGSMNIKFTIFEFCDLSCKMLGMGVRSGLIKMELIARNMYALFGKN